MRHAPKWDNSAIACRDPKNVRGFPFVASGFGVTWTNIEQAKRQSSRSAIVRWASLPTIMWPCALSRSCSLLEGMVTCYSWSLWWIKEGGGVNGNACFIWCQMAKAERHSGFEVRSPHPCQPIHLINTRSQTCEEAWGEQCTALNFRFVKTKVRRARGWTVAKRMLTKNDSTERKAYPIYTDNFWLLRFSIRI